VGYGLFNYRWVFSAGRFLQSAVSSGTSNPQLAGPVIRTSQLPPPGVPHVWNDASEPQQLMVELLARNFREFCRKWLLPGHFWVLLHAVNLQHRTDGFTSPPKEGALRIFSPEKSDGFGRTWTRELGYQRPARSPLDHRSRPVNALVLVIAGATLKFDFSFTEFIVIFVGLSHSRLRKTAHFRNILMNENVMHMLWILTHWIVATRTMDTQYHHNAN